MDASECSGSKEGDSSQAQNIVSAFSPMSVRGIKEHDKTGLSAAPDTASESEEMTGDSAKLRLDIGKTFTSQNEVRDFMKKYMKQENVAFTVYSSNHQQVPTS